LLQYKECKATNWQKNNLRLMDLSPYDQAVTNNGLTLEYFFDIWYRQLIVGCVIGEIKAQEST